MFRSYSLVNVIREGELKTEQINKNKSTREHSAESTVQSAVYKVLTLVTQQDSVYAGGN